MSRIDVGIEFPEGDKHKKPRVTNPSTQANTIGADQTSLVWKASSGEDQLELTGVTFYATKPVARPGGGYSTQPVTPSYLTLPGGHEGNDKTTWKIDFKPGARIVSQTELWYDLHFKDADFPDLDWDPKLTISPRGG